MISGKRPASDEGESVRKRQTTTVGPTSTIVPTAVPKLEPDCTKPIKRSDSDSVLNILLRLACQVKSICFINIFTLLFIYFLR